MPFEKAFVKDAPGIEPDGRLTPQEEDELFRHYGRSGDRSRTAGGASGPAAGPPPATPPRRRESEALPERVPADRQPVRRLTAYPRALPGLPVSIPAAQAAGRTPATQKDLPMAAILFGSISTLADTSELQRDAFNRAFQEHGLEWNWSQDEYRELLKQAGGRQRVADRAEQSGEDVDADAVHATKSRLFQEAVKDAGLSPRPGVVETIKDAKDAGWKIALVTTTSKENVDAVVDALAGTVERSDFDLLVSVGDVERPKPDESAYLHALSTLGEDAAQSVAIEDNLDGVQAAMGAGLKVAAFPSENSTGHDFGAADERVEQVSLSALQTLGAVA